MLAAELSVQAADLAEATGPAEVELIASEAGMSRAAPAGAGMPLVEAQEDSTEQARAAIAAAELPAWALGEAEALVAVAAVAVGGADNRLGLQQATTGAQT